MTLATAINSIMDFLLSGNLWIGLWIGYLSARFYREPIESKVKEYIFGKKKQ